VWQAQNVTQGSVSPERDTDHQDAALLRDTHAIYVGGRWVSSAGTERIDVVDPATERVVGRVPAGVPADVDRAAAAARDAFGPWSATPLAERVEAVGALAAAMQRAAGELAEMVAAELGPPMKIAKLVHVGSAVAVAESYVALGGSPELAASLETRVGNSLVIKEPVGAVGAITPWNYPLYQVLCKLAPALVAGCTVVLKPSEVVPLAVYRLAELIDGLGLPPGTVNLCSGTGPVVGEAIAAHPDLDMVSFTGSTRAGTRVAELAAPTVKRVALELGGKSAAVLMPDLDADGLAKAMRGAMAQAYVNSGQRCSAFSRILVPASRLTEAEDAATAVAATYRMGAPADEGVRLGPVVSATQRDRVRGYIDRAVAAGARLVTGGSDAPADRPVGYFVKPTVFSGVVPDAEIAREEVFGPVVVLMTYDDVDDAVRVANGTDYGLAAGVWAADPDAALAVARRLRAGQVDVNGGAFNPAAPFGGYKRSGNGRELGREGLEEFLETKAVQL
jgi:aldehyde dehydrogenase (NAD+)